LAQACGLTRCRSASNQEPNFSSGDAIEDSYSDLHQYKEDAPFIGQQLNAQKLNDDVDAGGKHKRGAYSFVGAKQPSLLGSHGATSKGLTTAQL
jgi:hypothetical protein